MATAIATAFPRSCVSSWYGDPSVTRIKAVGSSTNATSVKTSAGSLNTILVSNNAALARFLKFYDKASAPTVGTDVPLFTVPLPPNTAQPILAVTADIGIPFQNGIAFAITTGVADTDTNGTSADDVHGVIVWS